MNYGISMGELIFRFADSSKQIVKNLKGEEYCFGNIYDALNGTDDLLESYGGQIVYIVVGAEVIEELLIPDVIIK